jgi:hypothetical protein
MPLQVSMNADAMRDSFDYDTYWWIIERLSRTNRPLRFADLAGGFPAAPFSRPMVFFVCLLNSCVVKMPRFEKNASGKNPSDTVGQTP